MALASAPGHQIPWGGGGMRGKRKGRCRVQEPGSPGPGPGGAAGVPSHRTRPPVTHFAEPVARQNRPASGCGVPYMPGVSPASQSLLPHPQVQDWTPAACLPPATALCTRPGIETTPHRNRLCSPPASRPGQDFASVARKKTGGSRTSGRGHAGPWVSNPRFSGPSSSGLGRFSFRQTLPDREPQVCRPSITKFHSVFRASASGTQTGRGLPEARAFVGSKACLSRAYSPKVAILFPEPRRFTGAPLLTPAVPTRPQISGSPRDTLKGWLAGGQVCSPALNPGSPLWSLLSPG